MKLQLAGVAALTMVAGGFFGSPASAAETHTVCPTVGECDFTTIQAAVNAAVAGDTIDVVEDLTVAVQTNVNKDVTVTSSTGSTVTQTATVITFLMSGAGSTLSELTITSDTPKAREFVQIGANDVTLSGNTIFGPAQTVPMVDWVGNRGFVTQGNKSGLIVDDNTFHSMRSGAYLNGDGTGTISNNTLYNTKGDFLIANANFTFTGNKAGDGPASEWGFVIFEGTQTDRYADLPGLSQANNCMTAWDQRGPTSEEETYIDADCDGVVDSEDAFPNDPTESSDEDSDGTGDNTDNCLGVPNPQQNDNDGDGDGDACDADDDNDGVNDEDDEFPFNEDEQSDTDNDGVGDNEDPITREDCKNGGFANFNPAFKNQGQCVSFYAKA